jgi:hypothetical protein
LQCQSYVSASTPCGTRARGGCGAVGSAPDRDRRTTCSPAVRRGGPGAAHPLMRQLTRPRRHGAGGRRRACREGQLPRRQRRGRAVCGVRRAVPMPPRPPPHPRRSGLWKAGAVRGTSAARTQRPTAARVGVARANALVHTLWHAGSRRLRCGGQRSVPARYPPCPVPHSHARPVLVVAESCRVSVLVRIT